VANLSAAGSSLLYGTYLGGTSAGTMTDDSSYAYGIAVDRGGQASVTGQTLSSSFPTVAGAYQSSKSGTSDAFATTLNSAAADW